MHREGKIVLSKKDIQKTGLSAGILQEHLLSFYQKRREQGEELYEIRVYAKHQAIEIVFVGRDVRDTDVVLLQDSILPAIIKMLAGGV